MDFVFVTLLMRVEISDYMWFVIQPQGGTPVCLDEVALDCGYRVCEVCGVLECSERYLYEVIKRDIGSTPKAWMREQRMVVARRMLDEGISLTDVYGRLGFGSLCALRREFRTMMGVSLCDYIRTLG